VSEDEGGVMDIDAVDDSSTSGCFRSSSGGLGSRSSSGISISGSSSRSISNSSTSSGSMSTTTSSKTNPRKSEAEKLLDSLSTGDPTEDMDSASLRDQKTASGRSSIAPEWQSFDREGRSTRMFQHSTGINY
jgi:hypothetical protein